MKGGDCMDKSALLAMLGPEIKQMIRDYVADVQGDLRVAGDSLITGRMSATDLSLDGREVELGWIKDKWVWYYGSSTTILIYGEDITEIFPVGTKLRWTQGGGWLYAQTTNAAYASGVNTLTVSGDTVTNADIDNNYLSYQFSPPGWTFTGSGGDTPTGVMLPYGGTSAPSGWLLCQGQAVSRTTYSDLYAVIGTAFGAGDGSTTFNLPDLRGRIPVGLDSTDGDFDTLGEEGGEKNHTLSTDEMPSHNHTQSSHAHTIKFGGTTPGTSLAIGVGRGSYVGDAYDYGVVPIAPAIQSTGGGSAHNNVQPYVVTNWIVKY